MDTNGHQFAKGRCSGVVDLILATRNAHKSREFRELLQFQIEDLTSFPRLQIPEETGSTFEQNAIVKAATVSKAVDRLAVADDSGLEVDALGGAPGIYSARYAGENASDRNNVEKLLGELRARNEKPSARFRCVIALARNGRLLGTFEGAVDGKIVDLPRGTNGFGYDPVFQPNGFAQTFAEMPPSLKNKISHRAKAIAALREALRELEN
jgi:XTP/dITP diphosphohydrolase